MTKRRVSVYTRGGDDGTTGLYGGKRVRKDDDTIELLGTIDEAQAQLGVARAEADGELNELLVVLERDLWAVMGEVASRDQERPSSAVSEEMIAALEARIDALSATLPLDPAFSVPGDNRLSAALDLARTVVRRAERLMVRTGQSGTAPARYLNRLSDLCWILARANEETHLVSSRRARRRAGGEMGD